MANGHKYANLHVAEHPLIQHKLTLMVMVLLVYLQMP